jgi:ComF family protein
MLRVFDALMRSALELLFPSRCAACDQILDEEAAIFCATCALSVEPILSACPRCALPWPQPLERPPPCIACLMRPPRVEAAFAPYEFGGSIAQAVRRLKWAALPELSRPLGRLLADGLARAGPGFGDIDVVVPVPLHPRRLRAREFNQAALLAQVMAATLAARERARRRVLRVDANALVRLRDTPPQTGLGRAQRRHNVRGAFSVPRWARDRVRDKRVLLVDDVLTTGATADACASALCESGATAVLVLTLGRAMT